MSATDFLATFDGLDRPSPFSSYVPSLRFLFVVYESDLNEGSFVFSFFFPLILKTADVRLSNENA